MRHDVLSDEELSNAIELCAKEPIHIPGAIQSHGFMLVLDEDLVIHHISANFPTLNGMDALSRIGTKLDQLISPGKIKEFLELTSEGGLNPIRSTTLELPLEPPMLFDAIIHRSDEYLVLELEPAAREEMLGKQNFYRELMGFAIHLQKVETQTALYKYVVSEVRRITGFARVKLYRFDEEYNGTVVAESKQTHMASYVGLNFPHSDIPKQARELYARNYLRIIPDIHYSPAALLPNDLQSNGKPLDLSFSVLRSISPVHVQYLENMNVQASMSISIMQNDRLWGLVACHHDQPHHVSYPVRMVAESFGHTFSAFLSNLKHADQVTESVAREGFLNKLNATLSSTNSLMDVFKEKYPIILQAVNADGVIIHLNGKYYTFGLVPEVASCAALIEWLKENHEERIFSSHAISHDTQLTLQGQNNISGILAAFIGTDTKDYIAWFREERCSQVHWAGRPEKHVNQDSAGFHLTPRASFERWKEDIRGMSAPWTDSDIEGANIISKLFVGKKYEEVLRQKNDDLNSILNHSHALIYIIDLKGTLLSINKEALQQFGLKHEEVIGSSIREVFDAPVASVMMNNAAKVVAAGESMTFEKDFIFNGKEFHLINVKFPLYNASGDIYALCSLATDITALRKTQSDLMQSNKELERMAFIASHDLQEPLRLVVNFTQMLQKEYQGQLDDKADKYISYTVSATHRMQNLITDLLEYSRLNGGEPISSQDQNIDAQAELDALLHDIYFTDEENKPDIVCKTPLPHLPMRGSHFTCVMQNLISNGLKYCPKGRAPKVEIFCEEDASSYTFGVKDNGIGIKPEYHEKIFFIFRRLHANNEYTGTGVGLALCKRIIDSYGGKIWLSSQIGEGATFYFSLPK